MTTLLVPIAGRRYGDDNAAGADRLVPIQR